MDLTSEVLSATFIYGLVLIGLLNNCAIMVLYAYGAVRLYRKVRIKK